MGDSKEMLTNVLENFKSCLEIPEKKIKKKESDLVGLKERHTKSDSRKESLLKIS